MLYYLLTNVLFFSLTICGNTLDFQHFIKKIVPLRKDGKISIPKHIKHVKLDIGLSFTGHYSQHWLTHEEDLIVFGFEPNPISVKSLLNGTYTYGRPLQTKFIGSSFFLIPCALGLSNNAMISFYVTKNDSGCSSIYPPRHFPIEHIIEVPIFSLSNFFDLFPFDTHPVIDYIKIDTQGSDLDIVKSAGNYLQERVIYITLEAENEQYLHTDNSKESIDHYMRSIGFVPHVSPYTLDPTYFNPRYAEYIKSNTIKIYQL